jgi:hypothetical protein
VHGDRVAAEGVDHEQVERLGAAGVAGDLALEDQARVAQADLERRAARDGRRPSR